MVLFVFVLFRVGLFLCVGASMFRGTACKSHLCVHLKFETPRLIRAFLLFKTYFQTREFHLYEKKRF